MPGDQDTYRVILDDAAFESLVTGRDVVATPAPDVEVRILWARQARRREARAAYQDPAFTARECDHCGRSYQGPAVYCSPDCALADA